MPDGALHFASPLAPEAPSHASAPERGVGRRFVAAAALALALHAAAVLPFVLFPTPAELPTVIDAVELSPVSEPAAPEAAQAEPASVAESVEAPSPEPLPTTAEPPPPPDTVEAVEPAEATGAETPPQVAEAEPPPEPVVASEPDLVPEEPPPPEETMVAALPPPPPPSPPVHAAAPAPRRPVPRTPEPGRPVAEAPAAPAPAQPAPVMQRPPPSYIGALLAALERHKEYPTSARLRRAEGTVMLRFTLRRDGAVSAWRIERSAGDGELDAAVERMIRRASPLPAPPPDMPGEALEMVVPVRFALR